MDHLIVEIDAAQCRISVFYDGDGDGIPIEVHSQEEGAYVPEMVFGHLSNCDPNVEEVSSGRSSYGVKLANIFSTEFVIEIADRRRERKYKQVFSENMGKKSEPQVTFSLHGANWTKFTFKPDIAKFNMTHLDDDAIALLGKRVVDIAGILAPTTLQVSFNSKRLPRFLGFPTYVNMYLDAALLSPTWKPIERIPRIIEKFDDQVEVVVSLTEGEFDQVSFVNKAATFAGGPHVDYVLKQITEFVASSLDNKGWGANTEEQEIKRHLWIFINMLVENPTFSPPTKEALVGPLGGLESFKLSDLFLDQGM
jgi:DNA topoisomerase-2